MDLDSSAATCLQILGLHIDTLRAEKEIEVEAYLSEKVANNQEEEESEADEEGEEGPSSAMQTQPIRRKFPKGSLWLTSTRSDPILPLKCWNPKTRTAFCR